MAGEVWPLVRPMVSAALDRTDLGRVSDLDTDVLSGRALLWVIQERQAVTCAVVTRLEVTQHSKVCLISAIGGSGRNRWLHLIKDIEDYATAEGCDCIRWIGRGGWKRVLPDYQEVGVVMERKING